jgi:hypothetical protein
MRGNAFGANRNEFYMGGEIPATAAPGVIPRGPGKKL